MKTFQYWKGYTDVQRDFLRLASIGGIFLLLMLYALAGMIFGIILGIVILFIFR
jgi:hypothetical protein